MFSVFASNTHKDTKQLSESKGRAFLQVRGLVEL
jgi:hypothetical protein